VLDFNSGFNGICEVLASGFFGQGPVSAHYIALEKDITINGQPDALGPSAYSTRHFPGIFNGFARFRPYTLDMWEISIRDLLSTVQSWIAEEKLSLEYAEGGIRAGETAATIRVGDSKLVFEPAEFTEGQVPLVVRLYSFPAMRQVFLVGPVGNAWEVRSTQHVPFHMPWNQQKFNRLVDDLLHESTRASVR